MKAIWQKALPVSMLCDWRDNYGRFVTKRGANLPPHDDKMIAAWKQPVEKARTVFKELAGIPWSDEFLRRDTIDIARMVLDRMIILRIFELSRDVAAWRNRQMGELQSSATAADALNRVPAAASLAARARELADLCDLMADVLALHTDYSLWESFLRLDAVEKVRNPDFPKTLLDNASCNYCRSHQYELARHWYAPRMKHMASRLADAVAVGNRKVKLFDDSENERKALMGNPLESLRPTLPRTWECYRETLSMITRIVERAPSTWGRP